MDYETFKEKYVDKVKAVLNETSRGKYDFQEEKISKLNNTYDSLVIRPEGSNVGVNANIQTAYEAYKEGASVDEVVASSLVPIVNALENMPEINTEELSDYDFVKDKLSMEVVAIKGNEDVLGRIPHKNMEDLAVVYRIDLSNVAGENASTVVSNAMLENFGIDENQLHQDAVKNAAELHPVVMKGMFETLTESLGVNPSIMPGVSISPEEDKILVATNDSMINGASVIAYQDFMDKAAERIGGDFFILPSSRHEVLLVPDDGMMDITRLRDMVCQVNATEVSPEDRLTDSVYHYDSRDKVFELGEKFIARQAEKENDIDGIENSDVGEHKSVIADLQEKKSKVASNSVKETADKFKDKGEQVL